MTKLMLNLIMGLLYLFSGFGQSNNLEQKVNINLNNIELKEAIQFLQSNYDLKFSYVDNMIPLEKKISLNATNKSLKAILTGICNQTNLEYQLINNQIVLKPAIVNSNTRLQNLNDLNKKAPNDQTDSKISNIPDVLAKAPNNSSELTENSIEAGQDIIVSSRPVIIPQGNKNVTEKRKHAEENNNKTTFSERIKKKRFLSEWLSKKIKLEDNPEYEVRPFHLGFIYPVSTNGIEAGQFVNNFSLHILAGYSAGLDGVEFSGISNVEKDYVKGIQFAGVANLTGRKVDGIQFGGVTNITGGNVDGAQFAGVTNITAGTSNGAFFAGATNLINNYTEGGLFAGAVNVVADSSKSAQFAGAANINLGSIKGVQAAGALNIAGDVKGSQIAGAVNITAGDIIGVQIGGALNVARNVIGSQIGVLNIADSVSGVPIGVLSLVRKGYHHVELWGGESLHANIGLKLGVEKFYNIFALTTILEPDNPGWGFGYGIGTQFRLSNTLRMNLDAISFAVFDERNTIRDWDYYHSVNQLRFNFGWQLAKHLTLFAGPTFNVEVADVNLNQERHTDGVAPYTFYDKTFNNTNVKMWAGFNAGVRF